MAQSKKTRKKSTTEEFEDAIKKQEKGKYILRLYVTGMTPNSRAAIEEVRRLCDIHLKGRCDLLVIDVFKEPLAAREKQIVALPTLIKELPLPIRKFVGDMSKYDKILAGLEIRKTT